MTEAERADFKKAFDEFDVNKDGHITSSELKTVLGKLGQCPSDEEVKEFIAACDIDKNGTIEFNEFCGYLVNIRRKVGLPIFTLEYLPHQNQALGCMSSLVDRLHVASCMYMQCDCALKCTCSQVTERACMPFVRTDNVISDRPRSFWHWIWI